MERDRQLIVPPRVERDLLNIWQYSAEHWSPAVADRHLRDINQAALWLCQWPFAGKAREELRPGLRSVFVNPHIIFYRLTDQDIEIVRILNSRQELDAELPTIG
jgi:toxin ParE1/3/4